MQKKGRGACPRRGAHQGCAARDLVKGSQPVENVLPRSRRQLLMSGFARRKEGEEGVTGAASQALVTRATGYGRQAQWVREVRHDIVVLGILRMLSAVVFPAPRIQIY